MTEWWLFCASQTSLTSWEHGMKAESPSICGKNASPLASAFHTASGESCGYERLGTKLFLSSCHKGVWSSCFYCRCAIELIRLEGAPALERMQTEMDSAFLDLTIILRLAICVTWCQNVAVVGSKLVAALFPLPCFTLPSALFYFTVETRMAQGQC